MNRPAFDCLCAGIVVADHVCAPVDHIPAPGELVLTERMDLGIGGCASNAAVDLARLGLRAAVAGTVGMDAFGRFCREVLEAAGVDCRYLGQSPARDTSGTLVLNTRGADRRFIHSVGANADFTGREVTPELIRNCRVLYLGGYCLCEALSAENVAAMFEQARAAGVITVLDVVVPKPADYWPLLRPVLPLTDLFVPNDDEGRLITGEGDPLEQAAAFGQAGAKMVVITCGDEGCIAFDGRNKIRAGVYKSEFVDGTGSGDAFVAGYIYGLLRKKDTVDCLRYGSALGASCVRAAGATTGIFSADELESFVNSQPLTITRL